MWWLLQSGTELMTGLIWPSDFFGFIRFSWVSLGLLILGFIAPKISCEQAVHPLSIYFTYRATTSDSNQVVLEHPKVSTYRCFLPDLTEFTGFCRPRPSYLHQLIEVEDMCADLEREFHPAIADCR